MSVFTFIAAGTNDDFQSLEQATNKTDREREERCTCDRRGSVGVCKVGGKELGSLPKWRVFFFVNDE